MGDAEPPVWATIERYARQNDEFSAALLSIKARVEALEGTNSKPSPNDRPIRSSLVERVAIAISRCEDSSCWDDEAVNWEPEARAAIREVAAWLRKVPWPNAATALEKEVER